VTRFFVEDRLAARLGFLTGFFPMDGHSCDISYNLRRAERLDNVADPTAAAWRLRIYDWRCFVNRSSTLSIATSVSISSIPITIIGMPTTYSAVVPAVRRRKLGLWGASAIAILG
jgi:hypothetical protein